MSDVPYLLVSASKHTVTVGPMHIPGSGICATCVEHWARTAGWDRPAPSAPGVDAFQVLGAETASIAEQLSSGTIPAELLHFVYEIELPTGRRARHPVFPRANCPRCRELVFRDWSIYVHCSPLTGIMLSVEVSANEVAGSYSALGRFASPLPVQNARPPLKAQFALGKGHNQEQAIESCIGEALERYSLIYTGDERIVRAKVEDVPFVHPEEILLFSDRQYALRESWNATHDQRYWIPERFDRSLPVDLLEGADISTGEKVYVPAACCLMWYRFPQGEAGFASADSNGCAAGKSFAAAAASALLELIERDGLAIWWYNRLHRPAVSIQSFNSEPLNKIENALKSAHRDLYLLDITTDLAVPVLVAVSPAADGSEPLFAAAAHPSPREAALKAAAEAAQLIFSTVHTGSLDPELHAWLNSATVQEHEFLCPERYVEAPCEPEPMSAEQTLSWCTNQMAAAGLRPILVDQSRPDVLLKTVRAIVPGLRHIWARFGRGRLYDVPVRCGWLEKPISEEALNSILCMI